MAASVQFSANARKLHCVAKQFLEDLLQSGRGHDSQESCHQLIASLEREFEMGSDGKQRRLGQRGRYRLSRLLTRGQLARKVKYSEGARKACKQKSQKETLSVCSQTKSLTFGMSG